MIRSTFYGFTTALSGLKVSQTAMDVIGQNVSNANTDGYTRQRVNQTSEVVSTIGDKYGSRTNPLAGQGANVASLGQIRDTTLDTRFRTENASLGRYDAELNAMSDIETIFDEATTSGMRDSILALQDAFQDLSKNTGNDEFDALVKAAATSMSKLMNQYSQQLTDAYDQEIYDFENGSVADVNDILKSLSIVNDSIYSAEVAGDNPLELYDQRNTMLDQLSSYFDMDYSYERQQLAPNIIVQVLHASMKTADGQSIELINGDKFAQFGVELDPGATDSITDNTVKLSVSGLTKDTSLTYDDIIKKLQNDKPDYQPIDITPTYGTDTKNNKGVTNGIFLGSLNMLNAAGAYENGGSTVRGYKYYMNAMNTLASEMSSALNDQNRQINYTADGDTLYQVYNADKTPVTSADADAKPVYAIEDPDNAGTYLYGYAVKDEKTGNYIFTGDTTITAPADAVLNQYVERPLIAASDGSDVITAGNFAVSDEWNQSTVKITNTTDFAAEGVDLSGDNSNIMRFINLFERDTDFGTPGGINIFTGGFENFLSSIGDQIALDVSTETTTYDSYSSVVASIDNDRMSVSGVNTDEEAVDIYKFQRAYQAASRVMTAMDEMLDKLINSTGTAGR